MIGKIVALIVAVVSGILLFSNTFRFSSTGQTSGQTGVQSIQNTSLQNMTLPQIPQTSTPFSLDPTTWVKAIGDWFNSILKSFSDYITGYFKNIFPKSTPTFGKIFILVVILFILWLLVSKFEAIFRVILLVGLLISVIMLILSAIGFI
jgi:hypothetical protein